MTTNPETTDLATLYPREAYHEDEYAVLWHRLGEWGEICEAPIVATDMENLEEQEPWEGYFTHWSRLPTFPQYPVRELMLAPQGALVCDVEAVNG